MRNDDDDSAEVGLYRVPSVKSTLRRVNAQRAAEERAEQDAWLKNKREIRAIDHKYARAEAQFVREHPNVQAEDTSLKDIVLFFLNAVLVAVPVCALLYFLSTL